MARALWGDQNLDENGLNQNGTEQLAGVFNTPEQIVEAGERQVRKQEEENQKKLNEVFNSGVDVEIEPDIELDGDLPDELILKGKDAALDRLIVGDYKDDEIDKLVKDAELDDAYSMFKAYKLGYDENGDWNEYLRGSLQRAAALKVVLLTKVWVAPI